MSGIHDTKNFVVTDKREDVVHAFIGGSGTTEVKVGISNIKRAGGGHVDTQLDPRNFKDIYRDEYTTEMIPPCRIRAALIEELDYFKVGSGKPRASIV